MKSKKNKWLIISLKISLYIVLITGIVFLWVIYRTTPSILNRGIKTLVEAHKILGYIFLGLILWHALIYRKWYRAWISGKIKNKKKNIEIKKYLC